MLTSCCSRWRLRKSARLTAKLNLSIAIHKGDYLGLDRHVNSIYLVPSDWAGMWEEEGYGRSSNFRRSVCRTKHIDIYF